MERYNRQIILPELGEKGQQRLQQAKVLIVGVGGLGSPVALYLTGAGVGTIGLIDDDVVSVSNLQRQVLYSEAEVGMPKAIQAKKRLEALNHDVQINAYPTRLTKENADEIIRTYDIIIDGCDNFATRYLINDICVNGESLCIWCHPCLRRSSIRFQLPRRPRLPPLFPRRNRNAIHAPSAQRSIRCNPRHNRLCRSC